jgi:hypothetical protein
MSRPALTTTPIDTDSATTKTMRKVRRSFRASSVRACTAFDSAPASARTRSNSTRARLLSASWIALMSPAAIPRTAGSAIWRCHACAAPARAR